MSKTAPYNCLLVNPGKAKMMVDGQEEIFNQAQQSWIGNYKNKRKDGVGQIPLFAATNDNTQPSAENYGKKQQKKDHICLRRCSKLLDH